MAADVLEQLTALELLDRGDRVDGVAAAVDLAERAEDLRVRAAVEVARFDELDHVGDRVARQHHRAEHRLLGVEVVRRNPVRPQAPDVVSRANHR